ncbi:hypothetical protein GCM10028828_15740 [Corynebacterium tapiri]
MIDRLAAGAGRSDQAAALEHSEVLAHQWLRDAEGGDQFVDNVVALTKKGQDMEALRRIQGAENVFSAHN